MRIIAIEGLDKSGKHTQSVLLKNELESKGYKVACSEFHRYDTPTGELIKDWLYKKWDVSQTTIELIMAADKQAQQDWFIELKKEGYEYLILDRYIASQECYAKAFGFPIYFIQQLQRYMRKPDMTILIDIYPEISVSRKGKHGENDRYEEDIKLLTKVREFYNKYVRENHMCYAVDGHYSVEQVHEAICGIFYRAKQFYNF